MVSLVLSSSLFAECVERSFAARGLGSLHISVGKGHIWDARVANLSQILRSLLGLLSICHKSAIVPYLLMVLLLFLFFFNHFREQLFGLIRDRLITNLEICAFALILVLLLTFICLVDELFNGWVLAQFRLISQIVYHLNIAFLLQHLLLLSPLVTFVLSNLV